MSESPNQIKERVLAIAEMTTTPELSPCLFCESGGRPMVASYKTKHGPCHYGRCAECGATGPRTFAGMEHAMELWSTRHAGWLPIESAPKDKSTILLWQKKGEDEYGITGMGSMVICAITSCYLSHTSRRKHDG